MREFPQMGCVIQMDDSLSLEELREEVDDLRQLVKTLLTIIMENFQKSGQKTQRSIRLDESVILHIERMAVQSNRTFNNMVETILMKEATQQQC